MNREYAAKIAPFVKAFGDGKRVTCEGLECSSFFFDGDPSSYKILPDLITLPLTLRQSLEITRDMWDWLAENPKRYKFQWPGFVANGGYVPEISSECACCEYALKTTGLHIAIAQPTACNNCPLRSLWGSGVGCQYNPTSPFKAWTDSVQTDTKAAKQIADAARAELEKLDAQERGLALLSPQCYEKEERSKAEPTDPYKPFKDAIAQGKVVQTRICVGGDKFTSWCDSTSKLIYNMKPNCYRIKPEPKLRPWKPEEVPVGVSYRHKGTGTVYHPIQQDEVGIWFTGNADDCRPLNVKYKWEDFLKFYEHSLDHGKTWLPCGVLE